MSDFTHRRQNGGDDLVIAQRHVTGPQLQGQSRLIKSRGLTDGRREFLVCMRVLEDQRCVPLHSEVGSLTSKISFSTAVPPSY